MVMKRAIITTLAVLAAWWGATNHASAQFGVFGQAPVRSRPAVSPFINLGIGGGGALNYYGLVRPQVQGNEAILRMQQNLNMLNADGSMRGQLTANTPAGSQTGLQTGHAATYFNTGHYFPPQTSALAQAANTPFLGMGGLGLGGLGLGGLGSGAIGINSGLGAGSVNFGGGGFNPAFGSGINVLPR
jgi:hypothetical protein